MHVQPSLQSARGDVCCGRRQILGQEEVGRLRRFARHVYEWAVGGSGVDVRSVTEDEELV